MLDHAGGRNPWVLQGSLPLARAAEKQAERLGQQVRELETARKFCEELQQHQESVASLDTDACLRAHAGSTRLPLVPGLGQRLPCCLPGRHRRIFTFTPDAPVTTPAEFTDALFGYAQAQDLNLVITRKVCTLVSPSNGIEYRAARYYASVRGIPTARIRCVCCDPEFAEADVSSWRLRLMKGLHYAAPALFMPGIALLFLVPRGLLSEWWGIAILVSLTAAGISAAWYNAHFYYNDKDNQPHQKMNEEPACRHAGSSFFLSTQQQGAQTLHGGSQGHRAGRHEFLGIAVAVEHPDAGQPVAGRALHIVFPGHPPSPHSAGR